MGTLSGARRRASVRAGVFALAGAGIVMSGAFPGTVTVSAGGSTDTRLVVRGTDGAAWSMNGNDASLPVFGGGFTSRGGVVLGAPTVVSVPQSSLAAPAPGTPYYIAQGTDLNLWVRSETVGWRPLAPAGTRCLSDAGATGVSAHAAGAVLLVVACRGGDGALWYAQGTVTSDPNTLPFLTGWQSLGGAIVNSPAVAAAPPGSDVASEMTFFAIGLDQQVWMRTEASGWAATSWRCSGHLAAAAVLAPSMVTTFACRGADQAVWVSANRGLGWGPATSIGGQVIDGPGIALTPTDWTVVAEGADHAVWQSTAPTAGGAFGAWSSVGGVSTNGVEATALLYQASNP